MGAFSDWVEEGWKALDVVFAGSEMVHRAVEEKISSLVFEISG